MTSRSGKNVHGVERFPVAPLIDLQHGDIMRSVSPNQAKEALAVSIGVSVRTVERWHRAGLTRDNADAAAIAIGTHPTRIWPDQWEVVT